MGFIPYTLPHLSTGVYGQPEKSFVQFEARLINFIKKNLVL